MKIESIEQEYITLDENETGSKAILATKVILDDVSSPCILSRLMIDALGQPGKDNDMELINSGERCIIMWTQPSISLEAAQNLINRAIRP